MISTMNSCRRTAPSIAALATLCLFAFVPARAADVLLQDGNSSAVIDTQSQAGLYNWTVNGMDQMYQQWFWIRTDGDPEVSIDTAWTSNVVSDINGNGQDDTLFSTFNNGVWEIQLTYNLTGGTFAGGNSDMAETIRIRNVSGSTKSFSFFSYDDFDLDGTPGDDHGYFDNGNSIHQTGLPGTSAEVIASPNFSRWEIAPFADILNKLNDGVATNLSDSVYSLNGDVTFAMQWDFQLANNATFIVSMDKLVTVPEPTSITSLACGAVVAWIARLKHRRRAAGPVA